MQATLTRFRAEGSGNRLDVIAILLLCGVLLVCAALLFTLGAGIVAIVPLVLLLAFGAWMVWAFARGTTPATAGRRVKKAELLGPGGPDDPDRNRRRSDI
jgi:Flp pilus assembly protein TadB